MYAWAATGAAVEAGALAFGTGVFVGGWMGHVDCDWRHGDLCFGVRDVHVDADGDGHVYAGCRPGAEGMAWKPNAYKLRPGGAGGSPEKVDEFRGLAAESSGTFRQHLIPRSATAGAEARAFGERAAGEQSGGFRASQFETRTEDSSRELADRQIGGFSPEAGSESWSRRGSYSWGGGGGGFRGGGFRRR